MFASCGSTGSTGAGTITSTPATGVPTTDTLPTTTVPATTVPAAGVEVAIYAVRAEHLTVVRRRVAVADGAHAMKALLDGPTQAERAAGISTAIPVGTTLLAVQTDGTEAVVDLSSVFESGGGSVSMMLRMAQVVFTLTQFQGVDQVSFRLDGQSRDTISGEGLVAMHVDRLHLAGEVLAPILLERPFDGAPLAEPLVLSGMTNAFEATINYEVVAPDERVLLTGFITATCGTGCWGSFREVLPPLPVGTVGPVIVRIFDYSPKDGSVVDTTAVTLT